ncbi:hypothetical protein EB169_00300 [archaeon]|nr:hypothetical protein [archaeon]NDB54255.1 hypothetical protein [archaeon]
MARNRVIYQSQALFIAPSSTGCQVSGYGITSAPYGPTTPTSLLAGGSLLKKLDRVQNCNFNFTINRQDINEFGRLARLDSIVMESPTVGLDFSYYVTDGLNERLLGFNMYHTTDPTNTIVQAQSISGLLGDLQGNNYYILTVQEGEDVVGSTSSTTPANTNTIVAIGNGFISEYSFDASVGAIPTANVTVEAFNIKADALTGNANGAITGTSPAIDITQSPATKFTSSGTYYGLSGAFTTGVSNVTALRPGDISLSLPSTTDGMINVAGSDKAHIQSFRFTIPLSRTILQRLGNTFGFARVVNVPINMDVTISAIVSELKTMNLFDKLTGATKNNFTITLQDSNSTAKITYGISGAILSSENYSENLGDNQTVDLTFSLQLGGANDTANGVFMSGSYPADNIVTDFYKLGTGKLN